MASSVIDGDLNGQTKIIPIFINLNSFSEKYKTNDKKLKNNILIFLGLGC